MHPLTKDYWADPALALDHAYRFHGRDGHAFPRELREAERRLSHLQDTVSERLGDGFDPDFCMEEVRGRQCTRAARASEFLGNLAGFCTQHETDTGIRVLRLRLAILQLKFQHDTAYAVEKATTPRDQGPIDPGVYVLFNHGTGLVKIGMTSRRKKRLSAQRASGGVKNELLAWIPMADPNEARDREWHLHQRFKSARVRGEWFERTPELDAWLRTLTEEGER